MHPYILFFGGLLLGSTCGVLIMALFAAGNRGVCRICGADPDDQDYSETM